MNEEKNKNLTLIDCEHSIENNIIQDKKVYQSNPLKSDLYSRLNAFRKSQRKFTINDVIKDSLK